MKKLIRNFLCFIGSSSEGLFAPRKCKRYPEHHDGVFPYPHYKQRVEGNKENIMSDLAEDPKLEIILVIWKELDNGKYHVDEYSLSTCEDADRYIFNGLLKDENIKLEYVIRGKDFKNHYLERYKNARTSIR